MYEVLKQYEGQEIGINYDSLDKVKLATLNEVEREYFVINIGGDANIIYGYNIILSIVETKVDGFNMGGFWNAKKVPICIYIYQMATSSNGIGFMIGL